MHGVHGAAAASIGGQDMQARPRLVRAAQEFEAQMMKELLSPLSGQEGMTGGEDEPGSAGALGDFASEALGQALSGLGGLGIARSILQSLSQSGTDAEAAQGREKAERKSGMSVAE